MEASAASRTFPSSEDVPAFVIYEKQSIQAVRIL
jgi:hypothetical protein